jgi:exodeoxyribonuclease-3
MRKTPPHQAGVIEILKNKNIRSIYHEFLNEDFGKETKPTLFMYHSQDRPYHVDYCFVSSDFEACNVEVGDFKDWIARSDHMPIIATLQ